MFVEIKSLKSYIVVRFSSQLLFNPRMNIQKQTLRNKYLTTKLAESETNASKLGTSTLNLHKSH